jgi:predicted CXXCH cytochrome family protein
MHIGGYYYENRRYKMAEKEVNRILAMGAVLLAATILLSGCLGQEKKAGPTTFVGAKYVGSKVCKDCHAGIYEGWRATLHPYKVQEASEKTVVGDFYKNNELTVGGYTTKMFKKDGKYYITTLDNEGKEQTYEIKYTLGGSQWKQRYMTVLPNGAIHILPVQWNLDTKEWVDYHGLKKLKPGDKKYWASPKRTWQYKCGKCHSTGLEINHDKEKNTFDTKWVDFGAGCEACHGPGSNHVDATPDHKAETIVNPDKLNFRMGTEVCGSCHNRGASPDKKYGYPNDFLPGIGSRGLDFTYISVDPVKDPKRFWGETEDSKSHHQQFLDYLESKHGEAGIACWDCHTSHSPGESNKFQLKLPGSSLCKACHGEPREVPGLAGLSHTIHDFGSCVDCHMPSTAKSALPGDIRSHRFKVIKPEVSIKLLVDKAAKEDKTVLGFYGLEAKDVEGLTTAEVEELLKTKAEEAMDAEKPMDDLLWKVQPNSCNGCHNTVSPWVLQEKLEAPRLIK